MNDKTVHSIIRAGGSTRRFFFFTIPRQLRLVTTDLGIQGFGAMDGLYEYQLGGMGGNFRLTKQKHKKIQKTKKHWFLAYS